MMLHRLSSEMPWNCLEIRASKHTLIVQLDPSPRFLQWLLWWSAVYPRKMYFWILGFGVSICTKGNFWMTIPSLCVSAWHATLGGNCCAAMPRPKRKGAYSAAPSVVAVNNNAAQLPTRAHIASFHLRRCHFEVDLGEMSIHKPNHLGWAAEWNSPWTNGIRIVMENGDIFLCYFPPGAIQMVKRVRKLQEVFSVRI